MRIYGVMTPSSYRCCQFSGDYVAGLCLASDAVMALHEQAASARGDGSEAGGYDDPGGEDEYTGQVVSMHLPRRSAYVLR